MSATASERFRAWLRSLPAPRALDLARAYADSARARGVFVVKPDGVEVAIPPLLSPAVVEEERMRAVSSDAHHVLAGVQRMTAWLMGEERHAPLRKKLFGSFLPLEAEGLQRTWRDAALLATARVDFLVGTDGCARALEVNSTIPAMQGYSDCIAEAFLRTVGEARGLPASRIDAVVAENGRNTDDLLASLLAHHARLGGAADRPQAIAIVARSGDAQRGELEHYARRWSELGHEVWLAAPEACAIVDGKAVIAGRAPDLIYRHIFARRLDANGAFARMCLEPARFHVLNPIASHLEVKAMLGLVSAAAGDEASGVPLSDEERAATVRAVPWTRLLAARPARGPDRAAIPDLAAWVRAHRDQLVLKKSWDYGGKSVFLGAELDGDASQLRARSLMGLTAPRPVSWDLLVDHALADVDAWVVQELVHAEREPHLRVEPDGLVERALYVDLSAYTNSGPAPRPSGGAVRASESRIVNILGGGGLAPLVRAHVLDQLLA